MDRGAWWASVQGVARVRHDLATKPSPPQCWRGHYLVKAVPSAGGNSVFQKWLNCEPSAASFSHSWANDCLDPKGDLCGTLQQPLNLIITLFQCPLALLLLFSCLVVSNSLCPYGLQHARLPHPSLSTWVCSNSYPLSQWCLPNLSSSVILFSSCPQSFPASGSFPMSQLFALGGQRVLEFQLQH